MADFVFNIAKGRVGELFRRVDANDPATSQLTVVVLRTSGLESDAGLIDRDDLANILTVGTSREVANTGYARKQLDDTLITYGSPDDANDRFEYDIPDLTWTAVAAGDGWSKLLVCYNPTAGADSTLVPLTAHDFVVTPDGSDITAQVNASGFFRAS